MLISNECCIEGWIAEEIREKFLPLKKTSTDLFPIILSSVLRFCLFVFIWFNTSFNLSLLISSGDIQSKKCSWVAILFANQSLHKQLTASSLESEVRGKWPLDALFKISYPCWGWNWAPLTIWCCACWASQISSSFLRVFSINSKIESLQFHFYNIIKLCLKANVKQFFMSTFAAISTSDTGFNVTWAKCRRTWGSSAGNNVRKLLARELYVIIKCTLYLSEILYFWPLYLKIPYSCM